MPYVDPQKQKECLARWKANNPERLRELGREGTRRYRARHKEALRQREKENREKLNEAARVRYHLRRASNVEKYRAKAREQMRKRRQNPMWKLVGNLRTRIYQAIRGGRGSKSAKTRELLGCGLPELRYHLEKQFKPGMTWENYGPVWHADHARPCSSFDLNDPIQLRECFHFSNLQPLFAEENLRKGDKYAVGQ